MVEDQTYTAAKDDIAYIQSLVYRFASIVDFNRVLREVPVDCTTNILLQELPEITHTLQDSRIIMTSDDLITLVTSDVERFYDIHGWISRIAKDGHVLLKGDKIEALLRDVRYIARMLTRDCGIYQKRSLAQRSLKIMNLRRSLEEIDIVMKSTVLDGRFAEELHELLKATLLRRASKENVDANLQSGFSMICPHVYKELLDVVEEWSVCRVNFLRSLAPPARRLHH